MKVILKISANFGMDYHTLPTVSSKLEDVKKIALSLEERGDLRWVIVDENNDPLYWCQYHEANLRIPPDAMIATDDEYMKKLATKQGRSVLTTLDLLKQSGIKNPEAKLASFDYTKVDYEKAFNTLTSLIKEGVIEEIPSELDKTKIGKQLFGQDNDVSKR